ncbi:hypothetical protein FRC15_007794 [Serendipita sp. 397]|nr:hypothetical protein FRC15_007794 [Serendipita sp. 397]
MKGEKEPLIPDFTRRKSKKTRKPVLVIHGGAGIFDKSKSTPEQREMYKSALRAALLAGHKILSAGGSAMDAAVAAVTCMEGILV